MKASPNCDRKLTGDGDRSLLVIRDRNLVHEIVAKSEDKWATSASRCLSAESRLTISKPIDKYQMLSSTLVSQTWLFCFKAHPLVDHLHIVSDNPLAGPDAKYSCARFLTFLSAAAERTRPCILIQDSRHWHSAVHSIDRFRTCG